MDPDEPLEIYKVLQTRSLLHEFRHHDDQQSLDNMLTWLLDGIRCLQSEWHEPAATHNPEPSRRLDQAMSAYYACGLSMRCLQSEWQELAAPNNSEAFFFSV